MGSRKIQPVVAERFAANTRRHREAAGLSQEELAFRADIHRTQVSLIEGGHRSPRLDTLIKLAGALGVTPNDLVSGITWEPFEQRVGGFAVTETGEGRDG
jgi:transcriptional regulator with XRE-family HTH domain